MDVKKHGAVAVIGLITAIVVGGLTTSWQKESRLYAAKPSAEVVRFNVTTDAVSDMVIDGVFGEDGVSDKSGAATGEAGNSDVLVTGPSPALFMDFLADPDTGLPCFTAGDIYSFDGGGALQIVEQKKSAFIRYFFRAPGKDGTLVKYRIDGRATIIPDTSGNSFPKGDPTGYTVIVDQIEVSQSTGKRGNACEGSFPNALAIIYLDRK